MSEWVSEWLLFNAKWAIFSHIMKRTSYILMRWWWWWCLLCTRTTLLVRFSVLAHWNNSQRTYTHYPAYEPTSFSSYSLLLISGEATNTNFIAFGLTRLKLEPTIYHTGARQANHFTNDVVFICNKNKNKNTLLSQSWCP